MTALRTRLAFVQKFASAIVAQALLSAASLAVSLILLRFGSDAQYGYYVLVLNAIMLLTMVQNSFIGPAMVQHMTLLQSRERAGLIGGLYREQRRLLPFVGVAVLGGATLLWLLQLVSTMTLLLMLAAVAAALAALYREFFRMVLLAYRLPGAVLRGDVFYVLTLVAGAAVATLTSVPAITTVLVLCGAALGGGTLLARSLWRHEAWDIHGAPEILKKIASVGAWTTAGSVTHWSFSQGYNYLIVGTLDVTAVAASASTRLLMMPVNLLSGGVSSLMLPTASSWVVEHGTRSTFRRLTLAALGIAGAATVYLGIAWLLRDFLFTTLLHKRFAQRDTLLMLWSATAILMVFRDQILYLLLARGKYRSLTLLTFISAVVSLVTSYVAMLHIGVAGAPVGVLSGETVNVIGLILMSRAEVRRGDQEQAAAGTP